MEKRNEIVIGNKTFAYVKVSDLTISPWNVRPQHSELEKKEIVNELAESIKELGLQQLPVVTPLGEVFIGGRRTTAFKELGEEWMLAEIRDIKPLEQLLSSYSENFHRKAPNYLNEGELFKNFLDSKEIDVATLAKKLGVSEAYIRDRIRIHEKLSTAEQANEISFEQARILASIPEEQSRERLLDSVANGLKTDDLKRIVATTNAAKALIEGETEEVRAKAKEQFEESFYTRDLDMAVLKWKLEDWCEDGHNVKKGKIWWEDIGINSTEEAQAWFKRNGGRHIKDVRGSVGEWDKIKPKVVKKLGSGNSE